MRSRDMPPIAALRALDVAARRLSFTEAADELNVTQSAISHQIRHLEDQWEVKLFERLPRRLELTPAGAALAPLARDFFDRLARTLDDLRADAGHQALRVQVMPSFTVKWLVPRLQEFRDAHPEIDVWISTRIADRVTLDDGALDAAVHLSFGDYPGLRSWKLMDEYVFPVCRPRFLEKWGAPETPADLCRYPLLLRHHEVGSPGWEFWFEHVGVARQDYAPALREGTRYPDVAMALQAAFEGQGVALARSSHVWEDIQSGRLVRLFDIRCPFDRSVYFICRPDREHTPAVAAFRDWLVAETAISQAEYDAAEASGEN